MSYEEPTTETEILSADEQRIREMCVSLNRIEAPKDFEFKLKARIANSKPSDFRPRFGFALRSALPVLAMIFVVGLLAYKSGMFSPKDNAMIAESLRETTNSSLPQNSSASTFSSPSGQVRTPESPANLNQDLPQVSKNEIADNGPKPSKIEKKREIKKVNLNGSELKSVKPPPILQPKFDEPGITFKKEQNIENVTSYDVKEILAQFGIKAVNENGKWIVRSVVQNGVAESSGVRENDIIEAIDDQTVSNEPVPARSLNFRNITVTRSGGKLEIKLRNKP